ncbi:MAG TPA: TonB-dependent receptor [Cyclobacteriaceae bacterium]|nr:TonB-dependent receptor [Cyclobacteriaceae bacterium]
MKLHHQLCITLVLFLMGMSHVVVAQDQSTLLGQVKEANGNGLPYANIALIKADNGDLITGAVSDENGKFTISTSASGKAKLSISSIGFLTLESEEIDLKPGFQKNFGSLEIKEELSSLDEVTVQSSRPDVIIEADRTIVNIEGTVLAEGNTALDVIGRSPGVYVDADGNINLNGRSGVIVLLDDRQTYMSAEDLANFLRAMPADNIKSIEVISNPPAKFDAEGAAGVLNIKLKKNTYNGTNGNIQAGNQYNGLWAPFGGATVNIKRGKWTTNASLNYNEWSRFNDLDIFRRFQLENGLSEFDQSARLKLIRKNIFFSGVADYQINDKHSVGINLQASDQNGTEDGNSLTNISNPGSTDINFLEAINDSESGNGRLFTNLHYVGNLDTLGTKISADVDYTIMEATSLGLLSNQYWINDDIADLSRDRILTENEMDYSILTAKADFTKPFGKGKTLETGVKGSWVKSDNILDLQRSEEEEPYRPDPNSNHFIYNENVLAAYASYKSPISKKLDFQLGLRAEYADIKGNSVTSNQVNTQEYLDLFPSFYLSHKVSDKYSINYNANRRITRPYYRLLNPFVFYIDPLTTEEGNPDLKPQYANNFEMSHVIKGTYQFTLGYSRTTDAFGQVMIQDEETRKSTIRMENYDKEENFSLRMMLPVDIAKWWNSSNMIHLYNNKYQSLIGTEMLDVSQFSYMLRSQHNLTLPKGFKIEMVGMYLSPFVDGQIKIESLAWMDAGVTKSFKDDKLTLTVNGTDLFRTQKFRGNISFDKINTDIRQYNNNQGIRVTLRWKFSQGENFKVSERSGSTEERDRL